MFDLSTILYNFIQVLTPIFTLLAYLNLNNGLEQFIYFVRKHAIQGVFLERRGGISLRISQL